MSQRYKKEIEEILEQSSDLPAGRSKPKEDRLEKRQRSSVAGGVAPRPAGWRIGGRRWSLSPGRLMLTGIVLLLVGLIFHMTLKEVVPGVVEPLVWAGIALFVLAYILFFVQPRQKVEKRWRGRLVEDGPSSQPLWNRIRRWLSPK